MSADKRRSSAEPGFCQVCGDKAKINNYGALSCQSCKTFFRRNGFHPERARPCSFSGVCNINVATRRNCTACRLAKCLLVGMSPDLIRKEEKKGYNSSAKYKVNTVIQAHGKHTALATPRLTPESSFKDRYLTNPDWTLLANIIHCYDANSVIPQLYHAVERESACPDASDGDSANKTRIIVSMYKSIQPFISSASNLHSFTTSEQHSLFQRNLYAASILNTVLVLRGQTSAENQQCIDIFSAIHGIESFQRIKHISIRTDLDSTAIKLLLMVVAFSQNNAVIDAHDHVMNDSLLCNTHVLFKIQNIYVELLWKYLIYQHGFSSSVHLFSQLIQDFLHLIKNSSATYVNNRSHSQLIDCEVNTTKP